MQTIDRSNNWKDVWERKGATAAPFLHHLNGYDLLSAQEWDEMVGKVAQPLGLQAGQHVIECGCGAGAFLASLLRIYPGITVSGMDYSESLVRVAASALGGDFRQGDIRDLSFLPAKAYDQVLSFGAFQYLNSAEDSEKAIREMASLVKPGGSMYIGEISDLAKKAEAMAIRAQSHKDQPKLSSKDDLDHLYLPKSLFEQVGKELGFNVTVVDHTTLNLPSYQAARYRFSAYFTGPHA
jgi:cyclopropane fatty-acyl-phospholipid synthase-like methyltransferase